MSEEQRVQQKIADCQQRWERFSGRIRALENRHDQETRVEERIRLKGLITAEKTERQAVEAEWQALEDRFKLLRKSRLVQDARKLEGNRAYPEAIQTWHQIHELDPEDHAVAGEIERLEEKRRQCQHMDGLIKDLTRRLPEIRTIYTPVVQRLKQLKEAGTGDDGVMEIVRFFLEGRFSAEDFSQAWQTLQSKPVDPGSSVELDYHILAGRLQRGEIALFLGSDVAGDLDAGSPSLKAVVAGLAGKARYEGFHGPLSKIAEYYQITELGRSSLILDLGDLIGAASPVVPFYNLLATIEQPLVLISASYDTLLENVFRQRGKKFVLISSVIHGAPEYDVGSIFMQYSDRHAPERPCLEEDLSGLEPFDKGYSLIYKIRGCCGRPGEPQGDYHNHTLTVSEDNYFTFARYTDKLIPSYLVKKLSGRGMLFVGFSPRDWEDRLIVNAILNKRHPQSEPPYVIGEGADQFERAYWEFRNVRWRAADLQGFVRNLESWF